MAAPKKVDYSLIEPGWRAGIKPAAQLAAEYTRDTGISVTAKAITRHFARADIPRDLQARVRAKADAKVLAAMVPAQGSGREPSAAATRQIVEIAATEVATVRLEHRSDAKRTRALVAKLTAELAALTDSGDLLDKMTAALVQAEGGEGTKGLRDALERIAALPGRVNAVKGLTEALQRLVAIEREAYGMDAPEATPPEKKPVEELTDAELLASIRARRAILAAQHSSEGQQQ